MNWYAMGANAPSFIDEARERARAVQTGETCEHRAAVALTMQGLSRQGSIRTWRSTEVIVATWSKQ